MATAVLIDGAYFIKCFRTIYPEYSHNAKKVAEVVILWATMHLKRGKQLRELYRIFFYDCPPLEKKLHNPITKKV